MKWHLKLIVVATVTFFFSSCKDSNTQGRFIPASASIALHINGKTLSEKLPWSEIKANPLFETVYADSSVSVAIRKILDNPDNSGIDTKGDLLFFIQRDKTGGYVALEGTVKDEAAFKTVCNELVKNGTASEKDGINYISNAPSCIGWSKDKFVFIADAPQLAQLDAHSRRMKDDSIDISTNRDVVATCKAVFDLEESQSLAKEEKFSKLMKENGDMHFWINGEEMNKNTSSSSALAMINLEKLYKGTYSAGTANFDNGKINVSMKSYAGEEITNLYKKYGGGKVSEEMMKKMPAKDVMGIIALNFKPDGLREFLKIIGVDGFANAGAKRLGFTLDEFVKANKGDVILGFSDLTMSADSTGDIVEMPKPNFNFVFAASVGDKDAFNKLINAGKILSEKFIEGEKAPFAYSSNNNYFAISNSQENADKYINGSGSGFDFISKISGEPMGGYLNIQSIMKAFGKEASKDSLGKMIYDASLKLWDNVLFKGGDFKDGASQFTAEINLVDKNTNSLKQLNQYAAVISQVIKEKEKKQKEDMMALEDAMQNGALGDVPATIPGEGNKKK